ncbi:hypothetical protein [Streptosporangium sp. NBC_01469]|uniref:hypothetical protein n=1 Tax=Streptosporangium sp. NBC_01469 TaxID=2903898 RepID=UPI002E2CE0D5|nr:hypothetical protein [Streptosporangium sp. NBC_01469]
MSLLEDRYRHVLRLLPASYRAEREEEMVCAFVEGAGGLSDADNPRPRWSEIASVAALSVRVRLGGVGAAPRFLAWGDAVRLVAVLGLFFHAAVSCVWLLSLLRFYGAADQAALGGTESARRLWDIVQTLGYLLWISAFASLVRGHPRIAKILALLALALFYSPILQGGSAFRSENLVYGFLFAVPVLSLMAGFHRDAPQARHPRWTAVLPVVVGVPLYAIMNVLSSLGMARTIDWRLWSWVWPWLDTSGLACLALLVASAFLFGTRPWAPGGGRGPALPLALAILSVPVLLAHVSHLTFDAVDPATRTMAAVNIGQLVAVLLCGLALTGLAVRAMPALPPVPPPFPSDQRPEDR